MTLIAILFVSTTAVYTGNVTCQLLVDLLLLLSVP